MSNRAPGPFASVLRKVGGGLTLPIPTRVHILRELSYDLEALSDRLVADGVSIEEARRQASEALVPDAQTLHALEHLHAPLYKRITARVTPERLERAERWALVAVTTAVVVTEGTILLRAGLLESASPFLAPVLVLGAMLFAVVLAKSFQLWVKRDHAVPRRGLGAILALLAMTMMTGVEGLIIDMYRVAMILEASPELTGSLALVWLVRDAALLAATLIITLSGGIAWFLLRQWVAWAEGAHREVLGLDGNESPVRGRGD